MFHDDHAHTEFRINRGFNPEFLKKARASRKVSPAEKRAEERAEMQAKLEAATQRQFEDLKKAAQDAEEKLARLQREVVAERRLRELVSGLAYTVKVHEIIQIVAEKHGLKHADIVGPSHMRHIVRARHDAIAQAKRMRPDMSLPQLGRIFNRDHTTILHALRKMGVA